MQSSPQSGVGSLSEQFCDRTRFGRVRNHSVAPRSSSYGVEGLYLNSVLGPGSQALHCCLAAVPCSLDIRGPVLTPTICPPHVQSVSHGLRTAVVLRLWKGLDGFKQKNHRLNKCHSHTILQPCIRVVWCVCLNKFIVSVYVCS